MEIISYLTFYIILALIAKTSVPLILGSSYILKLILSWVQEDDLITCVVVEVGGGGGCVN